LVVCVPNDVCHFLTLFITSFVCYKHYRKDYSYRYETFRVDGQ